MQLVVVMAVRKAVSAATITFTATSTILFFIPPHYSVFTIHYSLAKRSERLVFVQICATITTGATARIDHEARSLSRHCEATAIHTLALSQLDA